MTLRIALDQDSGVRVVRLEGWLEGEAVAELERVMDALAESLRLAEPSGPPPTGRPRRRGRKA